MLNTIVEQLERDEGLKLKPYRDTVGKLTIGIGRNLDDVGLSAAEARYLLQNDIQKASNAVAEHLPWTAQLDEVRRAVFIELAFNIGIFGLLKFRNTLTLAQAGKFDLASEELSRSLWAKQVGDGPGGKDDRADRLERQLKTGEWQ